MKNTVIRIALLSTLAALPLAASAAMKNSEAGASVVAQLSAGASAEQIIETLVEDGRSLRDATAIAVDVAGGDDRIALAKAGICMSVDTTQAEKVGRAAIDVADEATTLVHEIEGAIEGYETGLCASSDEKKHPPSIYPPAGTSSAGGGVGVPPGGTQPPGGVIPPVSPSS